MTILVLLLPSSMYDLFFFLAGSFTFNMVLLVCFSITLICCFHIYVTLVYNWCISFTTVVVFTMQIKLVSDVYCYHDLLPAFISFATKMCKFCK